MVRLIAFACAITWILTPTPDASSASMPEPSVARSGTWQAPVPLRVLRPFVSTPTPWAAGHRGVDLAASPGTPVAAAGAGTVVYAGWLVDRPLVSIDHGAGLRTTYEPVHPRVRRGQVIAGGTIVGVVDTHRVGSATSHPPCRCLHWGLRRGTVYLDPLTLLARPILKPVTHAGRSIAGLRARVGLVEAAAQAFDRHVRVDLRRRDAGVTQEFLH